MILLKRRSFMTYKFNSASGTRQLVLTKCMKAPFKQFGALGNSHQNSTTGKQLFDARTIIRDMVIEKDGSIVSGRGYYTSDFIKVEPSTVYFINATASKRGKYFDENKNAIFVDTFSDFNPEIGTVITTHEKASYIRFCGLTSKVETIMLNKGDKASPYEPYTGGKPSPSPDYPQEIKSVGKWNEETQKYEVDVKITGKNLFDIDSFLKLPLQPDTYENGNLRSLILTLNPNTKYTLSTNNEGTCDSQDKDTSRSLYFTNINDNMYDCGTTAVYNGKSVTVTSDKNGQVKIVLYDRTNSKPIENKERYVMLNEGATAEPYEPYRESQTATITMDEPLRGIRKYQDEITKDGIARWINKIVLDGSEQWYINNSIQNEETINRFLHCINGMRNVYYEKVTVCDKLRWVHSNGSEKEGASYAHTTHGTQFYICLPRKDYPDIESFKQFLSKTPVTVQYALHNPVTEPLTQEQKSVLDSLYTFPGTTVITVGGGEIDAGIEVEYAVKGKEE